ncbi:MAG: T9SS type A sorting domain-containing protein [Flavipsychrobacter sp.]|nr:T9SS type A sorting domain-containing protein [Flavipsychrobacter sp.]
MILSVSASACYVNIAGPNGSASRDTVCANGSITITGVIIDASYQVNYQWKKNGVAITGTGNSGSFGSNPPNAVGGNGTFTFTFSGLVNGDKITCFISEPYSNGYTYTSNTLNITVPTNVTPSVAVSASPTGTICFGSSVTFTATPTNGGTSPTYQWKKNGTNVGTNSTHYTDAALNNGDIVSCVLTPTTICVSPSTATGSYTAVVNSVTPSVVIAGASSSCSGTSVTFTATPTNGGTTTTYQWKKNGTAISGATSSTYTTSSLVNNDAITCTITSNASCATTTTATSNTITETVTTTVTPSVSITGSNGSSGSNAGSSICSNTSVTFTAIPTNGGTPTYQWQKNNSPISGATGSTYTASGFSNSDVITVVMTSTATCATPSQVTSNGITLTVNPTVTPTVSIAGNATPCANASVTFTATPTNGGTPTYQWQKNSSPISGATGSTYTGSGFSTNDVIKVVMTSTATCATPNPVTSNGITMTVTPNVTPSVSIAGNSTPCANASVTFAATPTNGGTPTYQWKKNGSSISGATGSTYNGTGFSTNDVITVAMTSTATCATPNPVTSSGITMTVTPNVTPSVSITGNPSPCANASVTFTATPTNGGTPTYQWQKNGSAISGATGSTYTGSSFSTNDVITVVMTSTATCVTPGSATSNGITMTVTPNVTPSVSVTGSSATCSGSPLTFTANPINGGVTPAYQWQKNGSTISGATGNTYTDAGLNNNDVISVVMTSASSCATTNPVTSAGTTVTVTPTGTPSVSITGNATPCAGLSVIFTATPTNGGTPTYQWQKNNSNISGATSSTYTTSSLSNGDVIKVVMTSSLACVTTNTATSNGITITPTSNVTPSVSITGNATSCANAPVTFTATQTNGGTPTYQWQKNGSSISGATGSTYTASSLNNNDAISVVMTSTASCTTSNPVTSNTIIETVTPNVIPTVVITGNATTCANAPVTFTATPTNGGTPTYQWQKNGSAISGATGNTYTSSSLSNNDVISVVMTSTASCTAVNPVTSNTITEIVTPTVTPSVSISGNATTCSGSSVTFIATPTNGGTPSYQWWKNNNPISGATNSTYADASLNTNDAITVVMTSTAACTTTNPVTSNIITETVTTSVTPVVSISGNATSCANTSVMFTATPTNGGTPAYQWQKNNSPISGATGATYATNNLSTNDVVSVVMTSTAACATVNTVTSNMITETVTANVTPSVSITSNQGTTTCSGSSVTFTAAPTNGGTPTYQWTNNGSAITGATGSTYTTTTLNNNDQVAVVMTSTATCVTTNTANSNVITEAITPVVTPSVSISGNSNTCAGTPITFTATPTNGGSSPTYQWTKNGSAVTGATGSTYTDASLNNNDAIACVLTSNVACATTNTATSNTITMSVNGTAAQPGAFTVSSSTTYDGQTGVVYTVPNIPGTTYTWSYSGTDATISGSGNSVTLNFSPTATSGILNVTATTNACATPSAARSITITVKPFITWTCGTNNDWNNAANWDAGFVPTGMVSVYIPSNTPCQPSICSAPASAYKMMVGVDATVNICCSNTLTVNNDLTIDGSILGCGKVTMVDTTCHIIYGSGRIDNFELNNSCGAIINPGDTLHIGNTYTPTNGVLTINGELELLSDSNTTASILTHPGVCNTYIVGDVICDKFIHGGRRAFRFLGHPFSTSIPLSQLEYTVDITGQGGAANGFTTTVTDNPSAFWYNTLTGNGSTVDDSTGWIPFTNTNGVGANAWNAFEGIRLFMRGSKGQGLGCGVCVPDAITIKMHSTINECDQTVTLGVNNNVGFNFISNPYPSAIDMSQVSRGNAIGANFNVWDPNQGLVGAYVEQPFNISYILPAYSAFFTTCNGNAGKSLTFHENDKTTAAPTGNLFKTSGMGNDIVQLRILSNNDSLSWDRLLLMFNDNALAGTDQVDGAKLSNPDLSFYTFSADNDQLAIDQRPYVSGQVIKLGINTDVNQTYSIRVDDYSVPTSGIIYLHDKYLNQVQQLQQGMHYSFTVTSDAASQGDNRFELNMSGTTGIANVSAATEMKVDIFPNPVTDNATIAFEAPQKGITTVTITNLVGQQVYINQLGVQQSGKVNLSLNNLTSGIYMVTLKCGDFTVTKRLAKQ